VGRGKVLISNPEYKGKGRIELASSILTKICGLPEMMEFTDDDMEEELSNELVVSLKQKITAFEE
jgi:hypothetical protein